MIILIHLLSHFMCKMVVVAQLVRAPDCGSGGRRFETDLPPKLVLSLKGLFLCSKPVSKTPKSTFS